MMNKKVALLASLCLLVMAIAVSAQDKMTDFSGDWELNVDKSELSERSRIESMKMKVVQSKTELSVERTIKRESDGSIGGALGRGQGTRRGNRGGGMRGAFPTTTYDLTGKETKVEMADGIMTGETKLKAKSKNGKLTLTQKRTLNTRRGARKIKLVETWVLSADGKTLTVSSVTETPRGNRNSKMVFSKTDSAETPKRINGGVINGKAKRLPKPDYSEAARMGGLRGTVRVQVVIDTNGDVISARALSGHPILKTASLNSARKAKFEPTFLDGKRVEVIGIIIYKYQ